MFSQVLALKQAGDQMVSRRTDHHTVGGRLLLQPGGEIRCLAHNSEVLTVLPAAHLTRNHQSGIDADTNVERLS